MGVDEEHGATKIEVIHPEQKGSSMLPAAVPQSEIVRIEVAEVAPPYGRGLASERHDPGLRRKIELKRPDSPAKGEHSTASSIVAYSTQ
jgi:hypothetical protein